MSKLRLAVIGVGHLGQVHARLLSQVDGVELVAVVDPAESARAAASVELKVTAFAEHAPLLDQIDAAIIAAPSRLHHGVALDLLQHGIHVFVEKPITLHSAEAMVLTDAAKNAGLVLQVGHIFRFDPASVWLREAIAQGRFGQLKMLRAQFSGFKRPRPDTGVTFADSIHFIDLLNFLLGTSPRRVHAVLRDFLERGIDDESLIVLEYDRGDGVAILATVEAGYHSPGKVREVIIVGKDSSAICDYNVAQYKIKTFDNRHAADSSTIKAIEGAVHQLEFTPEEPLRAELAAFVDSIENRSQPLVDGLDGVKAIRVVEAALESARTGKWIDISE